MRDDTVIGPVELALDPRRVGDERHTLLEFLDYYRSVLVRKAVGLTREQLGTRVGRSTLTLAGLLKHMALVEDAWFHRRWTAGGVYPEPWASVDWDAQPDWDFDTAPDDDPTHLLGLFEAACARSRAVVADVGDLDAVVESHGVESRREPISMRWILVHMIEEYARHCGHADLLREAIDGQTGD